MYKKKENNRYISLTYKYFQLSFVFFSLSLSLSLFLFLSLNYSVFHASLKLFLVMEASRWWKVSCRIFRDNEVATIIVINVG